MSGYTPGPWTLYRHGIHHNEWGIYAGKKLIAVTSGRPSAEADGLLLTAAPDLLEAAETLVTLLDYTCLDGSSSDVAYSEVRRAEEELRVAINRTKEDSSGEETQA